MKGKNLKHCILYFKKIIINDFSKIYSHKFCYDRDHVMNKFINQLKMSTNGSKLKKRQENVNNLKIRGMFYCNKNRTKVLKIQLLDKNIGILSNHWLICPNKQVI